MAWRSPSTGLATKVGGLAGKEFKCSRALLETKGGVMTEQTGRWLRVIGKARRPDRAAPERAGHSDPPAERGGDYTPEQHRAGREYMEYVLGAGPFAPEKVAEASHLGDKLLEAAETLVHAVTLLWIWRVRLLGDPLQGVFKAEVANW